MSKNYHFRGTSRQIGASSDSHMSPPRIGFPRLENSNCRTCCCNARRKWRRLRPRTRHGFPRAGPRRLAYTFPCCYCRSGIAPYSPNRSRHRRRMRSGSRNTRPPSCMCFQFHSPSSACNSPSRHSIGRWGRRMAYKTQGTFRCCRWRTHPSSTAMLYGWGRRPCRRRPIRAYVDRCLCSSRTGTPWCCPASCRPSHWNHHTAPCICLYRRKTCVYHEERPTGPSCTFQRYWFPRKLGIVRRIYCRNKHHQHRSREHIRYRPCTWPPWWTRSWCRQLRWERPASCPRRLRPLHHPRLLRPPCHSRLREERPSSMCLRLRWNRPRSRCPRNHPMARRRSIHLGHLRRLRRPPYRRWS